MVNPRVNPLGSRAQGMKLSLLFPPLLANQSQPQNNTPFARRLQYDGALSISASSSTACFAGRLCHFRLKQLQGSYPNRPAGRQTDAQRGQAIARAGSQRANKKTGRAGRQDSTQAGNRRADEQNKKQTNIQESPPEKKETLPTAARVSTDPGVYLVLLKAARVSADPGVCLTNQHTGKSPPKKRQQYQRQPQHPQTPESTSQIGMQGSPPKKEKKHPQRQPESPRAASADPGVYLRDQHTGKSPNKKRSATKRQPEYPQTPQSSEADIPESSKKQRNAPWGHVAARQLAC